MIATHTPVPPPPPLQQHGRHHAGVGGRLGHPRAAPPEGCNRRRIWLRQYK